MPWLIKYMFEVTRLEEPLHSYDKGKSWGQIKKKGLSGATEDEDREINMEGRPLFFHPSIHLLVWYHLCLPGLLCIQGHWSWNQDAPWALLGCWLVKTHLDGCGQRDTDMQMKSLSVYFKQSCRMDKKFLSSSCTSDPRLQRLQWSIWGWKGQERALVTNPEAHLLCCYVVKMIRKIPKTLFPGPLPCK